MEIDFEKLNWPNQGLNYEKQLKFCSQLKV